MSAVLEAVGTHSEKPQPKEIRCRLPSCTSIFRPKRNWQHFCSTKCRNDWHHSMTPEAMRKDIDTTDRRVGVLEEQVRALIERMIPPE